MIRAVLFGLSLGAMTVAVLWLLDKMSATDPNFMGYALPAAAAASVGLIAMLLILFPTKKRIARRVDRNLALGEKVQTMLAFRKDESPMAQLQRMDTDRILQETPRRRVKGVCTWLFVLIPVVACLSVVGTILVPAKQPPEPPPVVENNFSITPWQEQALKDLIEKVKTSDMEADPKDGVVKQLESLLIKLKSIRKEGAMKEAVIACIEGIHKIVSTHNTYDLIAEAMFASPSDSIGDLGGAVNSLQSLLIGEWMNTTKTALLEKNETATVLATGITQALTLSNVEAENEVHIALMAFTLQLTALGEDASEEEIGTVFAEAEQALNSALFLQATNEDVEDDTIYTLLSIFGIKASEVPEHVFNDPEDPRGEEDYEPDDDLDHINSGGIGSGEMIFGSNDTIYDPDSESYIPYHEVIDGYYARITELLVDGNLPHELEEALTDYFAILFDGSKNKENN